jgi:hypothetical protein
MRAIWKSVAKEKIILSDQPSKSGGETAFTNGVAVTSSLPSVSSKYDNCVQLLGSV